MQVARRQVGRLAGLQRDPVEQQRGQHAGVARVALRQLQHGARLGPELAVIARQPHAPVLQGRHQRVQHRLRQRDPGGEQRAQPVRPRLARPAARCARPARARPARAAADRPRRIPETDQRVELGERADQLGLVVGVAVVAVARVPRDAGRILAPEALAGLLEARVGLQRQRLVRGQHLEQERQRRVPAPAAHRPEQLFRRGGHGVQQRSAGAVGVHQLGRVRGVRAQPHLGLRVRRRNRIAEQLGDHGARAPRIRRERGCPAAPRCLSALLSGGLDDAGGQPQVDGGHVETGGEQPGPQQRGVRRCRAAPRRRGARRRRRASRARCCAASPGPGPPRRWPAAPAAAGGPRCCRRRRTGSRKMSSSTAARSSSRTSPVADTARPIAAACATTPACVASAAAACPATAAASGSVPHSSGVCSASRRASDLAGFMNGSWPGWLRSASASSWSASGSRPGGSGAPASSSAPTTVSPTASARGRSRPGRHRDPRLDQPGPAGTGRGHRPVGGRREHHLGAAARRPAARSRPARRRPVRRCARRPRPAARSSPAPRRRARPGSATPEPAARSAARRPARTRPVGAAAPAPAGGCRPARRRRPRPPRARPSAPGHPRWRRSAAPRRCRRAASARGSASRVSSSTVNRRSGRPSTPPAAWPRPAAAPGCRPPPGSRARTRCR